MSDADPTPAYPSPPDPAFAVPPKDRVAAAQRALEARRVADGIPTLTGEEAARAAAFYAQRKARREEPLEAILARVVTQAPPAPAGPPLPETPAQRAYRLATGFSEAGIPEVHTVCPAGCRWCMPKDGCCTCGAPLAPVSWKLLTTLIGPEGLPALGGVEAQDGRLLTGAEAVAELRYRLSAPKVVLLGDTRAGKSVSAAAFAAGQIRAGAERVIWCNEGSLTDPGGIARACGGRVIVVDDIGEAIAQAGPRTGLAAQRVVPLVELFTDLARLRGKKIVSTTYLPNESTDPRRPSMGDVYGYGTAARIYEGAEVIKIRRAAQPVQGRRT